MGTTRRRRNRKRNIDLVRYAQAQREEYRANIGRFRRTGTLLHRHELRPRRRRIQSITSKGKVRRNVGAQINTRAIKNRTHLARRMQYRASGYKTGKYIITRYRRRDVDTIMRFWLRNLRTIIVVVVVVVVIIEILRYDIVQGTGNYIGTKISSRSRYVEHRRYLIYHVERKETFRR